MRAEDGVGWKVQKYSSEDNERKQNVQMCSGSHCPGSVNVTYKQVGDMWMRHELFMVELRYILWISS